MSLLVIICYDVLMMPYGVLWCTMMSCDVLWALFVDVYWCVYSLSSQLDNAHAFVILFMFVRAHSCPLLKKAWWNKCFTSAGAEWLLCVRSPSPLSGTILRKDTIFAEVGPWLYHLLVLPLANALCLSCKNNIMILCSTPATQTSPYKSPLHVWVSLRMYIFTLFLHIYRHMS